MIILGLGSNCGDRLSYLRRAVEHLSSLIDITLISPVYESDALLPDDAPKTWNTPFLNSVITGDSSLTPLALLQQTQAIEQALGREKTHAYWSPRTMDIDLLAYGDQIMQTEPLTLPHYGISERPFVVLPLADILPDWLHPESGLTAKVLAEQLKNRDDLLHTRQTQLVI